ncbi:MAG: DUF2849 domain-containing protein [Rhizobiaceae bacterium]
MKILTANRLTDGEAVWLSGDHSWAVSIEAAEIARNEAVEEKLNRAGHAALLKNEVIDVNLVDIELVDGRPVPLRLRERIRAAGPTTRLDLGKQAADRIAAAA